MGSSSRKSQSYSGQSVDTPKVKGGTYPFALNQAVVVMAVRDEHKLVLEGDGGLKEGKVGEVLLFHWGGPGEDGVVLDSFFFCE